MSIYLKYIFGYIILSLNSINHASNNKLNELSDAYVEKYGVEKLDKNKEKFIYDIINELGMTEYNIDIRKIDLYNERNTRLHDNAFVIQYFKNYLFISEKLFDALSEDGKRFLIGHELGHIYFNHSSNDHIIAEITNKSFDPLMPNKLYNLYNQSQELEADKFAITRLNCKNGALEAINLLYNIKDSYQDIDEDFHDLYSTHPSPKKREDFIKSI